MGIEYKEFEELCKDENVAKEEIELRYKHLKERDELEDYVKQMKASKAETAYKIYYEKSKLNYQKIDESITEENAISKLIEYNIVKSEEELHTIFSSNASCFEAKETIIKLNPNNEIEKLDLESWHKGNLYNKLLSYALKNYTFEFKYIDDIDINGLSYYGMHPGMRAFSVFKVLSKNMDEILNTCKYFNLKDFCRDYPDTALFTAIRKALPYFKASGCDIEEKEQFIEKLNWFDDIPKELLDDQTDLANEFQYSMGYLSLQAKRREEKVDLPTEVIEKMRKEFFEKVNSLICREKTAVIDIDQLTDRLCNISETEGYYYLPDENVFVSSKKIQEVPEFAILIDKKYLNQEGVRKQFCSKYQIYVDDFEEDPKMATIYQTFLKEIYRLTAIGWCLDHHLIPSSTEVNWDIIS